MKLSTFYVIGIILFVVAAIVLIAMMIMLRPGRMDRHYHNENNKKSLLSGKTTRIHHKLLVNR